MRRVVIHFYFWREMGNAFMAIDTSFAVLLRFIMHRGLDRYREQPKEYKYHDPYDDWIFRQLADIDNRKNIPNTSPQVDFNEADYEEYLKAKWNRGL